MVDDALDCTILDIGEGNTYPDRCRWHPYLRVFTPPRATRDIRISLPGNLAMRRNGRT